MPVFFHLVVGIRIFYSIIGINIWSYIFINIIYIYIMSNKTIAVPQDVYHELKKEKKSGETYGEVIRRLIHSVKDKKIKLEELAGVFEEDDEWDEILENIYQNRLKKGRLTEQ